MREENKTKAELIQELRVLRARVAELEATVAGRVQRADTAAAWPQIVTLNEALEGLRPHDHLCLIYESPEEWRAAAIPFLAIGLRRGEKCIYIVDAHTAEQVRQYLSEEGLNVAAAEASGQLLLLTEADYTREGTFDPERMIALLIAETEKALSEGYPALRVTGEMSWALRGIPGSERLPEYEARLNRDVFPKYPCVALCQYDRWQFAPEIIKGVVATHPFVMRGDHVYRNFYYIPPEEFFNHQRVEREVQHWLNSLEREREGLERERFLADILDRAAQPFGVAYPDGRIMMFNRAVCELTGYSEEELKRLSWDAVLTPPEWRELEAQALRGLAESGEPVRYEKEYIRKDGTRVPIELLVHLVRDAQGQVAYYYAFITDITERKRAERALASERNLLQTLIDNLPDAIYVKDAQSRFVLGNVAVARIMGVSEPSELVGKTDFDFFPQEIAAQYYHDEEDVVRSGRPLIDREEPAIRPSGELRWLLTSKVPLRDSQGDIVGLVGIGRDITEYKRLEEQFLQAQKMEAIGRLAGGVAHDFNNLLTVINGYSDLALRTLGPAHPLRADLEAIHKAGRQAADLTRQLLAFSRRQVLEMRSLNLNEALQDLAKMLGRLIGEDIRLDLQLAPDLGCVRADPGQIEQVVINLAVNARDAMPEGGTLTIETANVILDDGYARTHAEVTPGEYVMLAISDTGTGMSAEVKARIFEPFFTTKGLGKGTGLGLPMVYGIVKQHQGHIWVYSEPGKGSTFKVYLPRVQEATEAPAPREGEERLPGGSETVLVVEDDRSVRMVTVRILKGLGYRVLEAESGAEALRIAQEQGGKVDLLVTDVVMPGMGGKAVMEALRPLCPGLKCLFVSGYTDNAIAHHGILDEGVIFMQKPLSPAALARKVREVLDS